MIFKPCDSRGIRYNPNNLSPIDLAGYRSHKYTFDQRQFQKELNL